ncbi:MAG: Secretion system C-terminal sorting domain, partial [Bacteroidota bacterium]
ATDAQKALLNGDFLKIFPNPTSYTTTIAFENDGKGTHDIVICSLTGEVVQRMDAVSASFGKLTETTVSVSELPSGVYMVMIFYNGQRWQTRKLVIAHQNY